MDFYDIFKRYYNQFKILEEKNDALFKGKLKSNWTTIGSNIERPVEWFVRDYIIYSFNLLPNSEKLWLELYAEEVQNIMANFHLHKLIDLFIKRYHKGEE